MNQIVTVRMLQKLGYQVDLACDGASAISRVEANSYDIVLMDLNMPGIDGLEAARRIRRMPTAQSSVPIVALTASATIEDKVSMPGGRHERLLEQAYRNASFAASLGPLG